MTGRKTRAPPVSPYKALEKFSRALYGATWRYLQCTRFPSCHGRQQLDTEFCVIVSKI